MRLRREQDQLTPEDKTSYEEKLDDLLEELEGPEVPPEEERPDVQAECNLAGSDPAQVETNDSEMKAEDIVADNSSSSDEENLSPHYLAAKTAL